MPCGCESHAAHRNETSHASAAGATATAAPFAIESLDERARDERVRRLRGSIEERILIIDGAMGTMIQRHRLDEMGYRGQRFADYGRDIRGNNDLLTLTQPKIIADIHRAYFEAGADIVETNTFNSTTVAQGDYGMEALVPELNYRAARLAREVADEVAARTGTPRFVAGALGPTNRTASLSPDVNDPGLRLVSFDQLVEAYSEATRALVLGGSDLILIETVFDTLNAKAAIFAVRQVLSTLGRDLPVMSRAPSPMLRVERCRGRRLKRSGIRCVTVICSRSASTALLAHRICVRMLLSSRVSPIVMCALIRMLACQTPSVSTMKRPRRRLRSWLSSRARVCSTLSADAAVRPPTTSASSPMPCAHRQRVSVRAYRSNAAYRGSSRSALTRAVSSSTWASGPTSPVRRSFAS